MAEYPALDRLEQLASGLDDLQFQMNRRIEELQAQPVELESETGAVRVTVDHGGRVDRVDITSRGMRYSPDQLGAEITGTIRRAQREATRRLQDSMREVLGSAADDYPLG
ncbi:YbaB/EbfC family nucleoid-associated protein [Micromonospora sp. WMMD1102]|uniref:YbaB/EbfC family nucleoid-associated protein n=1 Tax=Micromonospora sp. WMMD1102 TaxID=3016105 RepID=UPI0024151C2D|nr:YbaB/EbfC family nucleoid-associated protein [Micromonospora sp. WMMD1102]MDG4785438.1 YbaB/EbfC family nucleoid-associated protein [Micromonospora sp. WMMD1102]